MTSFVISLLGLLCQTDVELDQEPVGAARMELGVAHFRAGRYGEALEAFDAASGSPDPPERGLLTFNRASALYGLGRYAEARRAFEDAARASPQLAALATLNAALSALEEDDLDRARAGVATLKGLPGTGAIADEVADLRSRIAQVEKKRQLQQAGLAFVEALNDRRAGRRTAARDGFRHALALGLDSEDAAAARDYIDTLSFGLRALGRGLLAHAEAGFGYDSNVDQLGAIRTEIIAAEQAGAGKGAFGTLGADVSYAARWRDVLLLQTTYLLDQLAYTDTSFDAFSLQVHSLAVRGEAVFGPAFRAGMNTSVDLQFTGLSALALFQRVVSVEPVLALDQGASGSTTLRVRYQDKHAFDAADAYFSGSRIDVRLGQKWRSRRLRAEATLRHRREIIGTRDVDLGLVTKKATGEYHVPYSYRSNAVLLDMGLSLGSFRMGIDGVYERLNYLDDNVFVLGGKLATLERRLRRADARSGFGAALTWILGDTFEASLRYDFVHNGSNIDFQFDNKNFTKQTAVLEISGDW